eukprot:m.25384 g.25384  ORF g.25384 m.25384 type:complete len:365 (-) comp7701_c0_seq2:32-1126(-)
MNLFHFLVASSLVINVDASTFSNVLPRRDTDGNIVNAHDGQIVSENGTYYWFAAGYLNCTEWPGMNGCQGCSIHHTSIGPGCGCGFEAATAVNLYTSSDLASWTFHGNVLPLNQRPANTSLFSPRAIYNDHTKNWVLWYNYVPNYSYAVATSLSPFGPFVTKNASAGASFRYGNPPGYPPNSRIGDFSLFKDDDGTGYMLYSHDPSPDGHGNNYKLSVARLSIDFLASSWNPKTQQGESLSVSGFEAPAMFKRNGIYYTLTSSGCCYCGEGGVVYVHTAQHPLGPYVAQNAPISFNNASTGLQTQGQQTTVTKTLSGSYIWQGDRWQSAPDHIKAHDFQFWYPLQFESDGSIAAMSWLDNFTLN